MRRRPIKPFRPPNRIRARIIRNDPQLMEANHLFRAGNFDLANERYLNLAQQAEIRDLPATNDLFIRAAMCQFKLSRYEEATKTIILVYERLLQRNRYRKIKFLQDNWSSRFQGINQEKYADILKNWIESNISSDIQSSELWSFKKNNTIQKIIPSHCPSCGAPIIPKELEWFDSNTPICSYCGCIIEKK